jgi:hypothetical protein
MPKVIKCLNCLKLRYSVYLLKQPSHRMLFFKAPDTTNAKHKTFTKEMERSDTNILVILGILDILGISMT